jgi:hypothetical protein
MLHTVVSFEAKKPVFFLLREIERKQKNKAKYKRKI